MSQPHQAIELLSNLSGEILAVSAGDAAGLESIRRTLQDAAEALGQQNSHLSDLLGSAGRIIQRALEDKQALSESQRMLAAKAIDLVCQQADPTCKARPRQVDLLGSQLVASLDEAKRPGCLEAPAFGDFDKSEPRKQASGPEPVQREDCPPSGAEEADDTSLLREYVDASLEHLAKAENCLLKLESNPHQENYIHQALRAFHTLKGSSAMMGFTPIEHMSHLAENLLSQARSGQIEIRESRTDIALQACDVLRSLVQQTTTLQRQQRLECPHGYDLLAGQLSLASCADWDGPDSTGQALASEGPQVLGEQVDRQMLGEFTQECLKRLTQAQSVLLDQETTAAPDLQDAQETLHGIQQTAAVLELEELQAFADVVAAWIDSIIEQDQPVLDSRLDMTMEALDSMRQLLDAYNQAARTGQLELPPQIGPLSQALRPGPGNPPSQTEPRESMRLGEILVGRGQVQPEQVEKALADNATDMLGKVLLHQGAQGKDVSSALRAQRQLSTGSPSPLPDSTVRVSTQRMDELVNLVGELLVAHSLAQQSPLLQRRFGRSASGKARRRRSQARQDDLPVRSAETDSLRESVDRAGPLLRDLHDLAVSLRMVPMRGLFEKARRMTRDLARRSGKSIDLRCIGEETEIDRNTVDLLSDPLVHLVRNAVDHGIESADVRSAGGKPPSGQLTMKACRLGANVLLSLEDDGAGLDLDRIRQKAGASGLIAADASLSDAETSSLIFHPGFTTSETVGGVSGRGVGMDVVRRSVEALHGRIDVYSEPGKGTRFEIRLPMTTAVEDALVIQVCRQRYLLPSSDVDRTIRIQAHQIKSVAGGRPTLLVQDRPVPVLSLCDLLYHQSCDDSDEQQIVLVGRGQRLCALRVEKVIAQAQVVVKPLGRLLSRLRYYTGAAVLGDGELGLILDASYLINEAGRNTSWAA